MTQSVFADDCRIRLEYAGAQQLGIGETFFNPLHNNPDVTELLLICAGSGTYQFDGKLYEARAHHVLFYNQGLWHEERSHSHIPYVTMYLGFSGMRLHGLPEGFFVERDVSPVFELVEDFYEIEQSLREIVRIKTNPSPESDWIADHLLAVFLAKLAALIHHERGPRHASSNAAITAALLKRYMHENYNSPITLEDLSEVAHLSKFHLSRLFKKETGLSPIQYLMHYRIEAAKKYLLSGDDTIESISERVGYESEAHFQHMFKRIAGVTPGKFRTFGKE